ncbi:RagB/SusD family nutrient uptake outer membrane protein [Arcticibacterium luteifluviistationis]|uniref:RagB/SusD family nutrient uptake outer membrane protein n=1 Tax=Arcticibacterium luteifluviistationis TaxID=1784714 RepID=A0A2Z4GFV9_9BACT|nr:RagB/SusD family nutrient uptake outer membrane protein [Arcticibacterium luteifluviistationis]AWV99947.1 RagB/SusD family nutrient uptake outer membrane protein [Arcticibacterium luteifluviistationis]
MKNLKRISTLALSCFVVSGLVSSCTDLIVEEKDSLVVEGSGGGFIAGDAEALLEGIYNGLSSYTDQASTYSLNQHPSAEMIPPTRGVDWGDNGVWRTLHGHTWDATHAQVLNAWNELNGRSYTCEQILASNPTPGQAAEARALRSFFMAQIMDLYGQVPRRTVDQGVDDLPNVMSRSEAFDFIVSNLEEALPVLQPGAPAAINSTMTQASVHTLLARLYLNKAVYTSANPAGPYTFDNADMAKVIAHADEVTAAGFGLDSDFFKPFTDQESSERIFTTEANGVPRNRWMMTMHYDQGGFDAERDGPWNGFTTLADFYDTFEDNDLRRFEDVGSNEGYGGLNKGFLIGQQYREDGTEIVDSRSLKPLQFSRDVPLAGAATEKGIRVIKYHPADKGVYMLLRYSDVYLMKAEALMRSGDNGAALTMINDLRTMRNASALSSLTEDAMFAERGRELYWEAIARTDEIRFGKFNRNYQDVTNTEAYTVLYPIPSIAIASNTNLTQNEGY